MNVKHLMKIIRNPNVLYILIKYGVFAITFINSILMAIKLEAYNLGVWGFINLVIGYMAFASLGIPYSVNTIISKNKSNTEYAEKIYNNSFSLLGIIVFFLLVIYFTLDYLQISIGDNYNFSVYSSIVVAIIILNLINENLAVVLRIYNKVHLISLTQSLFPILALFAILLLEKDLLLKVLVYILLFSSFLTSILYLLFSPFRFVLKFDWDILKSMQKKGIFLFIYAASFYCIMLSTKSFVSGNYKVEEFGFFTFSFSFANAVLLLMNTLSFLIFPKMIAVLSSDDNQLVLRFLSSIRTNYIVFSHLLIHTAIFLFPFFLVFFPQYSGTGQSFQLIGLTLIMYNNAFGYQGLLIARDEERKLSILSVSALLLNIVLAYTLTFIVQVQFSFVILSTMLTYFVYVVALTYYGRKSIGAGNSILKAIFEAVQIRVFVPYMVSLGLILSTASTFLFVIPLLLLILLNWEDMKKIVMDGKKLIVKPDVLNI